MADLVQVVFVDFVDQFRDELRKLPPMTKSQAEHAQKQWAAAFKAAEVRRG